MSRKATSSTGTFVIRSRLATSMFRSLMTMFPMRIMRSAGTTWQLTFIVRLSTSPVSIYRAELVRKNKSKPDIVWSYFRHDLESFEDWLSTELERKRCVVGRMVEFLRVVADRTDRGLAVTPKSPFCCVRDHGALRVLRGESGAPLLRPLLVPYASGYWRNDNVDGTMHVDR